MKLPSIRLIADAIGLSVEEWPGKCTLVVDRVLKTGLIQGRAMYGHYLGYIHPDAEFFGGRSFTHHGWIENKGKVIDCTRWVFENVPPYIYVADLDRNEYDFGGNLLAARMRSPLPEFNSDEKTFVLPKKLAFLKNFGFKKQCSFSQAFWAANIPIFQMELKNAEALYKWLSDNDMEGLIPYDNKKYVLDAQSNSSSN